MNAGILLQTSLPKYDLICYQDTYTIYSCRCRCLRDFLPFGTVGTSSSWETGTVGTLYNRDSTLRNTRRSTRRGSGHGAVYLRVLEAESYARFLIITLQQTVHVRLYGIVL